MVVTGFKGDMGISFGLTGIVYMKWFLTPNTGAVMEKISRVLLKQKPAAACEDTRYLLCLGHSDWPALPGCSMSGRYMQCLNKKVSLLAKHNLQQTTSASLAIEILRFLLVSAFALQIKGTLPQFRNH